ncbi:DDE-type integrase/transposase/recombinase [Pseudomonas oryzae]|nr:DDE-type integrase/transposase/recombinase [Pseudomonas oryzae]
MNPTLERLSRAHLKGDLIKTQEAPFPCDPTKIMSALSEKHRQVLKRRITYVKALIDQLGPHLPKKKAESIASKVATQIGDAKPPCYTVLYEWVKAYKQRAGNIISLIPSTHRTRGYRLLNQPEEVQKIVRYHIDTDYLTCPPLSKAEVIDNIQGAIYRINENREALYKLTSPSPSTLYRILAELDFYTVEKAQRGPRIAKTHQKWSKKYQRNLRILEIVEGDSHELDIDVVDSEGQVLGRPWLTKLVEIRTACVVGWDISLNPPSIDKTIRAIKASLHCDNTYGGLAISYVFDNGQEFTTQRLKDIMKEFGAEVKFCRIGNADDKPHVESSFKTWTKDIAQHLPGTTFSNPEARGDYDSESNAQMTLEDVKSVYSDWLENYYHKHFHHGLGMAPEEAWRECVTDEIAIKKYSLEDIDRYFLNLGHATPNAKGHLTINKVSWTSGAVPFLAKLEPKPEFLCVLYDTSDLGRAWAYHPAYPENIQPLEPVDATYQVGMTMSLHQIICDRLTEKKKELCYFSARQERARILNTWRGPKNKKHRKNSAKARELYKEPSQSSEITHPIIEMRSSHLHPTQRGDGNSAPYSVIEVDDEFD